VADDTTPVKLTVAKPSRSSSRPTLGCSTSKEEQEEKTIKNVEKNNNKNIFFKHCASNATYFTMHLFQV
jgi:hypothetical protein